VKKLLFTLGFLTLLSCSTDQISDTNNDLDIEKNISNESFKSLPIEINLFKVPKKGSFGCKTGFGLCFRIVIIIAREQEFSFNDLNYNPKNQTANFIFEKISNNKGKLVFPKNILESSLHNFEDFKIFEVSEDTNYGDVIFLKGGYELTLDKETKNLTYEIDVKYL
jgi:hypothetical protein